MPMTAPQPPSRTTLKRRAHHLKPIVQTGAAGMSEAVMAEIDNALAAHALVKIKIAADDRTERAAMIERACGALDAACIEQIGHTATLYRAPTDASDNTPSRPS